MVFSTLAHHVGGAPARADSRHTTIAMKGPSGESTSMRRWVLQAHVWANLLDHAGLTGITTEVLPAAGQGPRAAATLLVTAHRGQGLSGGVVPRRRHGARPC
jgi:hypothetical protein